MTPKESVLSLKLEAAQRANAELVRRNKHLTELVDTIYQIALIRGVRLPQKIHSAMRNVAGDGS